MSYRDQPPILRIIATDTPLFRASSVKGGTEWCGPCPFCGGTDRFRVQPEENWWWCRQCSEDTHWLSPADYLMKKHACTFVEAKKRMEQMGALPAHQQVLRELRNDMPDERAREAMLALAKEATARLWTEDGQKARNYLHARGLQEATIKRFRLGFHTGGEGLERCITIPLWGVDGLLYGLKGRLPVTDEQLARTPGEKRRKYIQYPGSRSCFFGRKNGRHSLLLVEGEMDAMVGDQELGDCVDVLTLGSCSASPTVRQAAAVAGYLNILIGYDQDEAGDKGARRWDWVRTARRTRLLPGYKDINQMFLGGENLRDWVKAQLAESWSAQEAVSLIDRTLRLCERAQHTLEISDDERASLERAIDAAVSAENRSDLLAALANYQRAIIAQAA